MKFATARAPSANHPAVPVVPLAEHPDLVEVTARLASVQDRLRQAEDRRARAQAATAAPVAPPPHSALERALLLVGGGHIPSAEPRAEIRASDDEISILKAAINELTAEKAEIESRLSYEISQAFSTRNRAALIRMDEALGDAYSSLREVTAIHNTLRDAGYQPSPTALPSWVPAALYALGDPDAGGRGQAAMFRAWIQKTFQAAR